MTLATQLTELREALRLAKESHTKYEDFVRSGGQGLPHEAVRSFIHYTDALEGLIGKLQSEISRRINRYAEVSILQLGLTNLRTGKSAKVACAKPSEKCELPSISETAYFAVCKKLKIPNGETPLVQDCNPLAVIGRNGQSILEIPPMDLL